MARCYCYCVYCYGLLRPGDGIREVKRASVICDLTAVNTGLFAAVNSSSVRPRSFIRQLLTRLLGHTMHCGCQSN